MSENTTSRRSVATGLAWSVPAVAVAVASPALAISARCLVTTTVVWADGRLSRSSARNATYVTADPDGSGPLKPLTISIANTYTGSNVQLNDQARTVSDNLRTTAGVIGGASNPLTLHQSPIYNTSKSSTLTNANKTETTFTFSSPVNNLTFSITDIDSTAYDFVDAVALTSATPFTGTPTDSTYLTGTGTVASPWRPRSTAAPVDASSSKANVKVAFAGPVSSFTLSYWNMTSSYDASVDGDQRVFLSNMTLTYNACA